MTKLWTCPKCGRQFEKKNQVHSCRTMPLANHFKGKPEAKKLYQEFKKMVRKKVGPFKVRSLQCCIHFDKVSTFLGIFAKKGKLTLHFSTSVLIKNKRLAQATRISANRYMYSLDLTDKKQFNSELINWLKQAYAVH